MMNTALKSLLRSIARDIRLMEATYGNGISIREALEEAGQIVHAEYKRTAATRMAWVERAREAVQPADQLRYVEAMASAHQIACFKHIVWGLTEGHYGCKMENAA